MRDNLSEMIRGGCEGRAGRRMGEERLDDLGQNTGHARDDAVADALDEAFGKNTVVANDSRGTGTLVGEKAKSVERTTTIFGANNVAAAADEVEGGGRLEAGGELRKIVEELWEGKPYGNRFDECNEITLRVREEVWCRYEKSKNVGSYSDLSQFECVREAGGAYSAEDGGVRREDGLGDLQATAQFRRSRLTVFAGRSVEGEVANAAREKKFKLIDKG